MIYSRTQKCIGLNILRDVFFILSLLVICTVNLNMSSAAIPVAEHEKEHIETPRQKLYRAIANGNVTEARDLIAKGTSAKGFDHLLGALIGSSNIEMVKLLLDSGASPYFIGIPARSGLHRALLHGMKQIVILFLNENFDLTFASGTPMLTPLEECMYLYNKAEPCDKPKIQEMLEILQFEPERRKIAQERRNEITARLNNKFDPNLTNIILAYMPNELYDFEDESGCLSMGPIAYKKKKVGQAKTKLSESVFTKLMPVLAHIVVNYVIGNYQDLSLEQK